MKHSVVVQNLSSSLTGVRNVRWPPKLKFPWTLVCLSALNASNWAKTWQKYQFIQVTYKRKQILLNVKAVYCCNHFLGSCTVCVSVWPHLPWTNNRGGHLIQTFDWFVIFSPVGWQWGCRQSSTWTFLVRSPWQIAVHSGLISVSQDLKLKWLHFVLAEYITDPCKVLLSLQSVIYCWELVQYYTLSDISSIICLLSREVSLYLQ